MLVSLLCLPLFAAPVVAPPAEEPLALEERAELVMRLWRRAKFALGGEELEYELNFDDRVGVLGRLPASVAVETVLGANGGEVGGAEGVVQIRKYDREGRFLDVRRWDVFDHFEYRLVFERNASGRLERVVRYWVTEETPAYVVDYSYDAEGRLTAKAVRVPGQADSRRTTIHRDAAGVVRRIEMHFAEPPVATWSQADFAWLYSEDGAPESLVTDRSGQGDDEVLARVVSDGSGSFREVVLDSGGRSVRIGSERLDAKGRVVRSSRFGLDGARLSTTREVYARTGDSIVFRESVNFRGGVEDWARLFETDFGPDGRVLFRTDRASMNGIGSEHVYTYEDDERGNWTRRYAQVVTRSDGELWSGAGEVLVRRLEYYD